MNETGRHPGETGEEIAITSEMIAAGVYVITEQFGIASEYAASEIAELVFRAMFSARPAITATQQHATNQNSGGSKKGV